MIEIKIIPGVTDLSQFPDEILKIMIDASAGTVNQMTESIVETMKEVEEIKEAQKVQIAERNRMKAELRRREKMELMAKLVTEHNKEYCHEPGGHISKPIEASEKDGAFYVRVPLPVCNPNWTFMAWEWATTFCRKNRCFYPTHEPWQDCRYIYLKMGSPLEG
jgi:hypothetical protein